MNKLNLRYTVDMFGDGGPWMINPEELKTVIKDMYFEGDTGRLKDSGITDKGIEMMVLECKSIKINETINVYPYPNDGSIEISLIDVQDDDIDREFTGF